MDLFSYSNRNLEKRTREGIAKHVPESGFIENWGEALRLEIDEGLSVSKLVHSQQYEERADGLMKLYDSGAIPPDIIERHTDYIGEYPSVNYNTLGQWANNNLGTSYLTDEQIQENIRSDLTYKRGQSEDVFNRANFWGKFGQFAGTTHALLLDPAYLPTYFAGIGAAAKGATWLSTFGRGALTVGAMEAGVEAVKQPFVYSWKKDIGADYSFKDAFSQIAMAGFGAGIIGGTSAALAKGLRSFVRKNKIDGHQISDEATKVVDNTIREADRSPDPNKPAEEHLAELEGEVGRQQQRKSANAERDIDESVVDENIYDAEIPEEDLQAEVRLETVDGEEVTTTLGKVIEEADELERQIEAVRGCL